MKYSRDHIFAVYDEFWYTNGRKKLHIIYSSNNLCMSMVNDIQGGIYMITNKYKLFCGFDHTWIGENYENKIPDSWTSEQYLLNPEKLPIDQSYFVSDINNIDESYILNQIQKLAKYLVFT